MLAAVVLRHFAAGPAICGVEAALPTATAASAAGAILIHASLSFLGLGVPPPAVSWGRMIGSDARAYFLKAPWMAIFPGAALSLTIFAFNVLGDALRDQLDPRLRGR